MQKLLNAMRAQALLAASGRASKCVGIVSGYSPNKYMAKVKLQPSGIETGWLPIGSEWVGNGWGLFAPPSIGVMVEVDFFGDDRDVGFIGKQLFNNEDMALAVPAGEFWLVHQSGSSLKFKNDGSVELVSSANLTATVGGSMNANVTGNAVINAATIELKGAGGATKGIVQGDCVCAYTGSPHPQVSAKVKGSM